MATVKGRRKKSPTENDVPSPEQPGELRGRVKSIVAPNMIILPEKLTILTHDEPLEENGDETRGEEEEEREYEEYDLERWVKENFPEGSNLLSLQRSHRGFGFTLKEKKV